MKTWIRVDDTMFAREDVRAVQVRRPPRGLREGRPYATLYVWLDGLTRAVAIKCECEMDVRGWMDTLRVSGWWPPVEAKEGES